MPETLIDSFERAARQRRSVYLYSDAPVERDAIERALRLAMLAPNHYRTQPWRFAVYSGDGRAPLIAAYEAAARRLGRDPALARRRATEAPVMIVVSCVPSTKVVKRDIAEEQFATAAATQNLLLALASMDIATVIATGELPESDEVYQLVGLERSAGKVMAVVSAGHRDPQRQIPPRPEPVLEGFVTWHEAPLAV